MKITSLLLNNIRSYETDSIFGFSSKINLLVGPNNCGKSTVIWALSLLQADGGNWSMPIDEATLRLNTNIGAIQVRFDYCNDDLQGSLKIDPTSGIANRGVRIEFTRGHRFKFYPVNSEGQIQGAWPTAIPVFSHTQPKNLFHLFLSRRKPDVYQSGVNVDAQLTVRPTIAFLAAKVDRLTSGATTPKRRFEEYLERVLGYQIATKANENGKSAGMFVGQGEDFIRIDYMGAGTSNIAAMLADLAIAKNKVFLIEEPENDIHPAALKPLLDIVAECSADNQFIISTHSHIVLSRLATASETKVFSLLLDRSKEPPITKFETLGNSRVARLTLMNELGYELFDSGQWEAVLVLEESSAERVIRDILIPHFAPKLAGRLQTVSANSLSKVELTYDALHVTYLYLNLSPVYKDKSWVRIDSGPHSGEIIAKLKDRYKVTDDFKFKAFQQNDFERYYPDRFQDEAAAALAISEKQAKRDAKKALLLKVIDWALADPASAKVEFQQSSAEVIADLVEIEHRITV